ALGYQPDYSGEMSADLFQPPSGPAQAPPPVQQQQQPPTSFEALFSGGDQHSSDVPPMPLSAKGATPVTGEEVGSFEINFREDAQTGSHMAMEKILRDELEGVDFYIAQGYMEIARDTLENLNKQYPNHPSI